MVRTATPTPKRCRTSACTAARLQSAKSRPNVRHLLPDQGLDLRLLLCRQQTAVSWRRPTPLAFQPRRATLRKALADIKDPGRGQPDLGRDRRIGLPCLAQPNHLPPSLLLRLRRQAPHVYVLHGSSYLGTAGRLLKKTGAGSIMTIASKPAGSSRPLQHPLHLHRRPRPAACSGNAPAI